LVGHNHAADATPTKALYQDIQAPLIGTSIRNAEMVKYTSNAWHAVKVVFANEIGNLCKRVGVDSHDVMDIFCQDEKLNLSPYYLKPGFAFGGSCLPKDLRALVYRGGRLDLKLPLLESVLPSNDQHLRRSIQTVLDLDAKRLGVYGLAFKENTDDLRESPVVTLLEHLIGKGRQVRVFDPHIQLDQIHGSNRNFILTAIPHIGKLLEASLENLLGWADHVVLAQKPARDLGGRIERSGLPVLNLVDPS
ncbi:MAG: nucleotide sugar dehydrogenase, partial [Bryobacteraceae bacterium]